MPGRATPRRARHQGAPGRLVLSASYLLIAHSCCWYHQAVTRYDFGPDERRPRAAEGCISGLAQRHSAKAAARPPLTLHVERLPGQRRAVLWRLWQAAGLRQAREDVISPRVFMPSPTAARAQGEAGRRHARSALQDVARGVVEGYHSEAEVFPEELDAALAVRRKPGIDPDLLKSCSESKICIKPGCMAAFLDRMREESVAGIMVPIIQLLLWPARCSEAQQLCRLCKTSARCVELYD